MKFSFAFKIVAACAIAASASASFAHIVLADEAALANTGYSAVLRVGHACAAGASTTGIRVTVPAGFRGAKPQPKPGWTVAIKTGPLAQPYDDHGTKVSTGVTEISWTAASKDSALPDAFYDEFVLRGTLPGTAGPMWFKVLQTCDTGSVDWTEVPPSGSDAHSLKSPAALLEIIPSDHVGHQH